MKPWWLERFGSPKKAPRIQDVALPAPLPSHIAIKIKAAGLIALTIIGTSAAHGQTASDRLQSLVETSARRLLIAQQVALAKWDSGAAVEDLPREAQVITGAVREGVSRGLDPTSVSNFFKAQIEANKVIQYSLLADWRRAGRAPAHAPIDLVGTIRPELDHVQAALIAELADTVAIRASTTCRVDVAEAIGRYVSVHKHEAGPLQSISLDRALAASCTSQMSSWQGSKSPGLVDNCSIVGPPVSP